MLNPLWLLFSIVLSNSSQKFFPNNTTTHFTTKLLQTVTLNEEYKVGVNANSNSCKTLPKTTVGLKRPQRKFSKLDTVQANCLVRLMSSKLVFTRKQKCCFNT